VKLKLVLITLVASAGFAASYALADNGNNQNGNGHGCHGALHGTMAAPQSFTVTVGKAGKHSGFKAGDVVTLSVGASGQNIRVVAEGCTGTDGTMTVRGVELQVAGDRGDKHHEGTTTGTTSNESTSNETTTHDGNND
jgi:hypothetical protein